METTIEIRMAAQADAKEILEIYKPYITHTAITFEYTVPTVEEFAERIGFILTKYPYIVATKGKHIIGYAYASAFKNRQAYDWAVETSIYVSQEHHGKGIGKKLYLSLEDILTQQNVLNLNACIAFISTDDPHLTNASMYFHQHLGYRKAAHFFKCGYKFGAWYDMIWMEKLIGKHISNPEPFIPITELYIT
ncbi:MAG TPA: GNAT family N-acetyltransferase [Ruminiclostridium sp.]|nr:GNAT family N-acetyltransferase [Ruminiclostridium sp.]